MVAPERLLIDSQGALIERLGLGVLALALVNLGEGVEGYRVPCALRSVARLDCNLQFLRLDQRGIVVSCTIKFLEALNNRVYVRALGARWCGGKCDAEPERSNKTEKRVPRSRANHRNAFDFEFIASIIARVVGEPDRSEGLDWTREQSQSDTFGKDTPSKLSDWRGRRNLSPSLARR